MELTQVDFTPILVGEFGLWISSHVLFAAVIHEQLNTCSCNVRLSLFYDYFVWRAWLVLSSGSELLLWSNFYFLLARFKDFSKKN